MRGPIGCRYLNDPERQRAYVVNGWNLTGDAFHADADGFFWYHSRTDDMIVSSGYNISGQEIEEVLLEHPGVSECAVVGVADAARGQIAKAFVVLRDPGQSGRRTGARAAGSREGVDRALQISARDRIRRRIAQNAKRKDQPGDAAGTRLRTAVPPVPAGCFKAI